MAGISIGGGGLPSAGGSFGANDPLDQLEASIHNPAPAPAAAAATVAPQAAAVAVQPQARTASFTTNVGSGNDFVPNTMVTIGANGQLINNTGGGIVSGGGGAVNGGGEQVDPTPQHSMTETMAKPKAVSAFYAASRALNPVIDWQYGTYDPKTLATLLQTAGSNMAEFQSLNPNAKMGDTIVLPMHDVTNSVAAAPIPDHVKQFLAAKGINIEGNSGGGGAAQAAPTAVATTAGGGGSGTIGGAAPGVAGASGAGASSNLNLASLQQLLATLSAYRKIAGSQTQS